MKRKVFFPGSFDPFTIGHEGITNKALEIFGELTIGVSAITSKNSLFSVEERVAMICEIFHGESKITVIGFNQLTADYCLDNNSKYKKIRRCEL
jgi:pantetheine-phosphate adenylyltransferase